MPRSGWVALAATIATLQPWHLIAAAQAPSTTVEAFRISTASTADTHLETLQEIHPASGRTTEVFPGTFTSTFGAQILKRLDDLLGRVGEADRETLVAKKVSVGFDRSITSWRAHPAGRTVALAVHYSRERLSQLEVAVSDDYGRSDPLDPADYEFFTVAVCSRSATGWTCDEEHLAIAAKKHNLALSFDRATWDAAAKKLLELVVAEPK